MEIRVVSTDKAPKPAFPYSQAIVANGTVYTSGVVGVDPATGKVVPGGIREQTARTLDTINAILESAGSSLEKVVKTTVFLTDAANFKEMNEVYASYFINHKPARATAVTGMVLREFLVEIEVIAVA